MIKVLKPGVYSTVQDQGRQGFASMGVPVSGVMDIYSYKLANRILNNVENDAVIEITLGNCEFQFLVDTEICISGAICNIKINENPVVLNKRIIIQRNSILTFGNVEVGVRNYIAIKGGVLTTPILKSRSFFKNITSSFRLKKGDELPIKEMKASFFKTTNTVVKFDKMIFNSKTLKCFLGPDFHLLSKVQQTQLLENSFTISKDHNRMGYRLNEKIPNKIPQLLTSSVLPGTVQLTPSGTLIVLMKDCQVTGGYPRVLQLSDIAISILSQKNTHNTIQFIT